MSNPGQVHEKDIPKNKASRPIARLFEKNAGESGGSKRGREGPDSFTCRISEIQCLSLTWLKNSG